jgi:phosphatidylglycerophosphate synthase
LGSSALARSRKQRAVQETLCEAVYRPLAHLVVLALLPLRVPPPAVAAAAGVTGVVAAVELGQSRFLLAAILVQLKTVLDNADGQLARLSGRVTVFGRYLDSELDLVVNAALFVAVGSQTGHMALAVAGFVALTAVLGVNFNVERLYRLDRGIAAPAMPAARTRPERALRRAYLLAYAPQDRIVERFVDWRLRDAPLARRRAYHDRTTVLVLANLGMSTQLAAFGVCIAFGRPLAFVWVTFAEVALVGALALRREGLVRTSNRLLELEEEAR